MEFVGCLNDEMEAQNIPGKVGLLFTSGFPGAYYYGRCVLHPNVVRHILEDREVEKPEFLYLTDSEFDFLVEFDQNYPRARKIVDLKAQSEGKDPSDQFKAAALGAGKASDRLLVVTNIIGNMLQTKMRGNLTLVREGDPTVEFGWHEESWIRGVTEIYSSEMSILGVDFSNLPSSELKKAYAEYSSRYAAGDQALGMSLGRS